jgi:cytochrome oxidase Cu insertion factor (SCO1/SenC/PrrC family)
MEKRDFLKALAFASMGAAAPAAFAQAKHPAEPLQRPAPSYFLEGEDYKGTKISLDDYAGKACLVSFFSFECEVCFEDLRLMREFYLGNKQRNFMMIGVNVDAKKDTFMEYVNLIELTIPKEQRFPIVWRNAPGYQDSFGPIVKKPTHFVLSKAHRRVLRREGKFRPDDWDDLWTSLA